MSIGASRFSETGSEKQQQPSWSPSAENTASGEPRSVLVRRDLRRIASWAKRISRIAEDTRDLDDGALGDGHRRLRRAVIELLNLVDDPEYYRGD